jgi:hypothetical protein
MLTDTSLRPFFIMAHDLPHPAHRPCIVAIYKAVEPGWQSRMNEALGRFIVWRDNNSTLRL